MVTKIHIFASYFYMNCATVSGAARSTRRMNDDEAAASISAMHDLQLKAEKRKEKKKRKREKRREKEDCKSNIVLNKM